MATLSSCKLKCDLDCATISENTFISLDKERKALWICRACKHRQSKSDNQNTPIRGKTMYSEGCMEKETEELATLNEFKNELTQATDFLAAEQADLKVKVEQKDKEIKELQTQTLKLRKEVYTFHGRLFTIEKISRDNNLEINGIQDGQRGSVWIISHPLQHN
ncbi:unnamed protein product [Parnassius apollo]|uniref:(apollo) hypothetical protein n=1 Tax=Parnassius apollo TaxID=110799 RepID=A0A8S3YCH1_PARAO|nr:unnamed protein product [Parnassius apollo]